LSNFVQIDVQYLLRTFSGTVLQLIRVKIEGEEEKEEKTQQPVIDRQWCEDLINSKDIPPTIALTCAHLLDATRHIDRSRLDSRFINWDQCRWDLVATSVSLDPRFDIYIHNAPYYSGLAEVKSALIRFFGKCIPVRCQCRVFPSIIRRALVRVWFTKVKRVKYPRFDDTVLQALKKIVLVALLGNYPHCTPGTRPTVYTRLFLYTIFTEKRYERWVVRLFHQCVTLVTLCVRTLMIISYDHNSALYSVLHRKRQSGDRGLFDIQRFKEIVESGMVALRAKFEQDLCKPHTALHQSFAGLPECPAHPSLYWVCDQKGCTAMPCDHVIATYGKLKKSIRVKQEKRRAAKRRKLNGKEEEKEDDEEDEENELKQDEEHVSEDIINDQLSGWSWQPHGAHKEINEVVKDVDKLIGKHTSYERSHADFSPLIVPLQKGNPLIPLPPTEPAKHGMNNSDRQEEATENKRETVDLTQHEQSTQKDCESRTEYENIQRIGSYERLNLLPFLPLHQISALIDIVESCGPIGYGGNALPRIVQFFPCFQIPDDTVERIQRWFTNYRHDSECVEKLKEKMMSLRIRHPHAYNLLHISVKLLKECEKRMKVWDLPHHIAVAQLEVLMDENHQIHDDEFGLAFVFCDVCLHIYSNLRDPNSPYKNNYRYGLREAPIDCVTGKVYCQRGKFNHRGRCGDREMARIPMIGRALHFQYKTILTCGQVGCGVLMVLDSKQKTYCLVNERGPACTNCSKKLDQRVQGVQQLEEMYRSKQARIDCMLCCAQMANPYRNAHIYPFDIHLCELHHNSDMQREVNKYMHSHPSTTLQDRKTNESAVRFIINRYKDQALADQQTRLAVHNLLASLRDAV
jgi:hypothetical protein